MPNPATHFTCAHCGQPHLTRVECLEHEADCAWNREGLHDPALRACPSCGGLTRTDGMFCSPKGGALVLAPVTLCHWWFRIPKQPAAVQAPEARA